MHSASIQMPDGEWKVTTNLNAVIDCDGMCLVNEAEEDEEFNLEEISRIEGKYATKMWNSIRITDAPMFTHIDDAWNELQVSGSCILTTYYSLFESVKTKTGKDKVEDIFVVDLKHDRISAGPHSAENAKWAGIIGRKSKIDNLRLTVDHDLWKKAIRQRQVNRRNKIKEDLLRGPRKLDFERLADKCAEALGCNQTKSFRIEQLWTWLAAHDVAFGRRATNKLAHKVALKWCNDRKASRKWISPYTSQESVCRIDERLSSVCRIGKEVNSRHKQKEN